MDKLNELMSNLENMFADKEPTRKKLAALEKAVSFFSNSLIIDLG
jgi:intracellular sulfur oxidation DsrE/DsrF family protein